MHGRGGLGSSWLVGVVCAVTLARPALAEEPGSSGSSAAETLFREGKALLDAGKLEEACRVLDESDRLETAGGTLLNLASCYERLGRYASAERALKKAALLADAAERPDAKQFIDDRLAAVAPNVSSLRVKLPPSRRRKTTVVEIDRTRVDVRGDTTSLRVDPGDHELLVDTEGSPVWRKTVTVAGAGKTVDVEVDGVAALSGAPRAPEKTPARRGVAPAALEPVGIVGVALGGGLLIGGGVLGAFAMDAWSDASQRCPATSCSDAVGVVRAGDAATYGNTSTALFVSGAIVAATGVTLLLVDKLVPWRAKTGWLGPSGIRF